MSHAEVRMELLYRVPADCATPSDLLDHLRTPAWADLVTRFAAPSVSELSPAAASVLALLEHDWRVPSTYADSEQCGVCYGSFEPAADAEVCVARLPCGHEFHLQCARAWLRQQNSCPACCCLLPRALDGTYALRKVSSVLDNRADVVGGHVRVVVVLELERVGDDGRATKCELSAYLASSSPLSAVHFDNVLATRKSHRHGTSHLSVLQHPSRVARLVDHRGASGL